jgi:micrococcal nuclease
MRNMILNTVLALFFALIFPELRTAHSGPENAPLGVSSLDWGPVQARALSRVRAAWPGPFSVEVIGVRDGDTVDIMFREGPCGRGPCVGQVLGLRLLGVDAPEIHACRSSRSHASCAACPAELALANRAKGLTEDLTQSSVARVANARLDKYAGRIVGDLQVLRAGRWLSVSDELLRQKLAVSYDGGRKTKPWCR